MQFEGVSYIDALDAWDSPPPALEIAPPSLRLLHITEAHSFIVRSGLLSHSNLKCPDIVTVSAHDARTRITIMPAQLEVRSNLAQSGSGIATRSFSRSKISPTALPQTIDRCALAFQKWVALQLCCVSASACAHLRLRVHVCTFKLCACLSGGNVNATCPGPLGFIVTPNAHSAGGLG